MQKHPRQLLVIIAESALEKRLVADSQRLGAQGYTVHDVRGGGQAGAREALWEADRTIEMKVICEPAVADNLARHVLQTYAPHHSVTMFFSTVEVLRPERF